MDLLLIRDAFYPQASDLTNVGAACEDVFASRADEGVQLGHDRRHWPPVVVANDVWCATWHIPAGQVGLELTLDEAIAEVNAWIHEFASQNRR